MYTSTLALGFLALTSTSIAAPREYIIEEHHVVVEKRQADVSQLLQLASLAGITALPTDPAVLLSLGPLANSLAAALPTPSVLSVLVTAAPSGFVSNIVNNPSYATSFESAFSAGSSPSWFNALPTDVKSYLHTYSGFGQLAGAAGGVKGEISATENGTAAATGSGSASGSASGSGSGSGSGSVTVTGSSSSAASSGSGASSGSMATVTSSTAGSGGTSASSAATAGGATSTSSKGGAAAPTGALAAGIVGVVGILGAAVVL